ncbi:MAG: PorP/SprF family type IX secretion system membrane protein [Bacteroidota bacterium]
MRTVLLLMVLSFAVVDANAQDPSFSQFYANRIYLNPAFTGVDGGLAFTSSIRNQWTRVPGGFQTYYLSGEIQYPCLSSGFGLTFFQDLEGEASLKTQSVGFTYAYTIGTDQSNIHIGLGSRWVEKSIDWSRLIFSDQIDPVFGPFDPETGALNPTSAVPITDSQSWFDADFGVLYRFDIKIKGKKKKGQQKRQTVATRNSVGISIHHLPSLFGGKATDESLQGIESAIPARLTIHAGSIIPIKVFEGKTTSSLSWSPNFKFDLQSGIEVFTYGFFVMYQGLYTGVFYQNRFPIPDAENTSELILSFGGEVFMSKSLRLNFGYSYDANLTGLGPPGGGTHEFTLRMHFTSVYPCGTGTKGKGRQNRFLDCKNFF